MANIYYQAIATSALLSAHDDTYEGRYAWLLRTAGGPHGKLKTTVLAELGRLGHDDAIVAWADYLCAAPPRTAREAVSLIRQARRGARPAPAGGLLQTLIRTVNDYASQHLSLSRAEMLDAISTLSMLVHESGEDTSADEGLAAH